MNKKMIFIVLFLVGGLMQEARGTSISLIEELTKLAAEKQSEKTTETIVRATEIFSDKTLEAETKSAVALWAVGYLTQKKVFQARDITTGHNPHSYQYDIIFPQLKERKTALLKLIDLVQNSLSSTNHSEKTSLDRIKQIITNYIILSKGEKKDVTKLLESLASLPADGPNSGFKKLRELTTTVFISADTKSDGMVSVYEIIKAWPHLTDEQKELLQDELFIVINDRLMWSPKKGFDSKSLGTLKESFQAFYLKRNELLSTETLATLEQKLQDAQQTWDTLKEQNRLNELVRNTTIKTWPEENILVHINNPSLYSIKEILLTAKADDLKENAGAFRDYLSLNRVSLAKSTCTEALFQKVQTPRHSRTTTLTERDLAEIAKIIEAFIDYLVTNNIKDDYNGSEIVSRYLTKVIFDPLKDLKAYSKNTIANCPRPHINQDTKTALLEKLKRWESLAATPDYITYKEVELLYTFLELINQSRHEAINEKIRDAIRTVMAKDCYIFCSLHEKWTLDSQCVHSEYKDGKTIYGKDPGHDINKHMAEFFTQPDLSSNEQTLHKLFDEILMLGTVSAQKNTYTQQYDFTYRTDKKDSKRNIDIRIYILNHLFGLNEEKDPSINEEYKTRAALFKKYLTTDTIKEKMEKFESNSRAALMQEIKLVIPDFNPEPMPPLVPRPEQATPLSTSSTTDSTSSTTDSTSSTTDSTSSTTDSTDHSDKSDQPKSVTPPTLHTPAAPTAKKESKTVAKKTGPGEAQSQRNHLVTGGIAVSTGLAAGSAVSLLAHLILKNGPALLRNHYNLLLAERASLEADNQDTTAIDKKLAAVNKQLIALKGRNKKITAGAGIATGTAAALLALLYQHNHGNN